MRYWSVELSECKPHRKWQIRLKFNNFSTLVSTLVT